MFGFSLSCLAGSVLAARGAFASRQKLLSMSKLIGTRNLVVARIACFMGLVLCTGAWVGTALVLALSVSFSGGDLTMAFIALLSILAVLYVAGSLLRRAGWLRPNDQDPEEQWTTPITVEASLWDCYSGAYAESLETHYAVFLSRNRSAMRGYVPRDSQLGREIYNRLQDGKTHKLTLTVSRVGPQGETLPASRNEVRIEALIP
jgi:hypothetical protein